jgi:ribonuclease Z
MTFELTVLGSSSALPTSTKFPSAHVLNLHERFFLIDCGEGTQIQLRRSKTRFGKINHIFLSHMHGDHVFGLFGVLSTFNLLGRKTPLHLYGHSDLSHLIDFYTNHFSPENAFPIILHKIVKRDFQLIHEDKLIEVYAFPLKHRVPTFGYLFREKERPYNIRKNMLVKYKLPISMIKLLKEGKDVYTDEGELLRNAEMTEPPYKRRSYAFCSDTMFYKKLVPLLNEVDLLYHEATFAEEDKKLAKLTGHSTASQAATIAKMAGVKELIIGHLSNRYAFPDILLAEAREIFPNTNIAEELKKYTVALSK